MIREYREEDLGDLMEAWEAASASAHPFLPPEYVDEVRKSIPTLYLPNAETSVVEVDGRVVGFIALLGSEVGAIFVAPDYQGKGLGRALMDKAREEKGQLEVEVFLENEIGCAFYRRYGFEMIAEKTHEETGCGLLRFRSPA